MPRIFIWKQYGDIYVYSLELDEQIENLYKQIQQCCVDLGLPSESEKLDYVGKIIDLIGKHIGTHEVFEHGTGFSRLRFK